MSGEDEDGDSEIGDSRVGCSVPAVSAQLELMPVVFVVYTGTIRAGER